VAYYFPYFLFLSGLSFAQPQTQKAASFSDFRPRREMAGKSFVGQKACADCHKSKTQTQSQTAMAKALKIATESEVLRSHPKMTFRSGPYSFEIVSEGGQNLYRVSDGQNTLSEPILYAFGNAHVAQTYVYRRNGKLYEARVSYYTAIDALDWTIGDALNPAPSLEEAAGRDIDSDEARNCFSCHGTAAVVDAKLQLEHMVPGVTCEACHGPGGSHAAARLVAPEASGDIFNPKMLDAETLSQEFCGACHRGVDAVAMMPDLGGINNVRFQPYRLFNSRGHDSQNPQFACTTCHDPHLDLQHGGAAYDAKCTTCHSPHASERLTGGQKEASGKRPAASRSGKSCPVASERCVSCHMPKVEIPGAHFKFTDHRIRVVRPGDPYPY
jgi:Cytochrome c554 and c-prime